MIKKRFVYYEHKGADYILDNPNIELDFIEMLGDCLEPEEIVDLLNEQYEQIKELKIENENLNNILEDFMVMLNRLQAEPNNEILQSMAKDMLRMMGKDIMGDVE